MRLVSGIGGIVGNGLVNAILVKPPQLFRYFNRHILADGSALYLCDGRQATKTAGDKGFISSIHIVQRKVFLMAGNAFILTDLDNFTPGNTIHTILSGGGPDFIVFDHEKIGGVAGAYKAVYVEHERLIGTGFERLNKGLHLVLFAVAVEAGIQIVGRTAPNGAGKKGDALAATLGISFFVFGDDDQVGSGNSKPGILAGRLFDAACEHDTDVHMVVHIIGIQRFADFLSEFGATHPNIESDCGSTIPEAIEVFIQKDKDIVMETQCFPDAVSD